MNDFGLSGALYLGQLSCADDVAAGLRERRASNQLAADHAILRNRYAELVRSYEQLASENQTLRTSVQTMADNQAQDAAYIAGLERNRAELTRTKAALERTNEDQRLKLLDATSRLAVLDQIMREQFPTAISTSNQPFAVDTASSTFNKCRSTMRCSWLPLLLAAGLAACSSPNVKSAKDYSAPRAPQVRTPTYNPNAPYGEANATWTPPTFNRDGTVVRPLEPSSQADRPNYEFAPWATGASGGSQFAPAGTF